MKFRLHQTRGPSDIEKSPAKGANANLPSLVRVTDKSNYKNYVQFAKKTQIELVNSSGRTSTTYGNLFLGL